MRRIGKLVGAAYVAAAAVLFYFLCLRVAPSGALPALILFALGTGLWSVAAQALWTHGPWDPRALGPKGPGT